MCVTEELPVVCSTLGDQSRTLGRTARLTVPAVSAGTWGERRGLGKEGPESTASSQRDKSFFLTHLRAGRSLAAVFH